MWQNVRAQNKMLQRNVEDLWPFCENPVCPDPVWEPVKYKKSVWENNARVASFCLVFAPLRSVSRGGGGNVCLFCKLFVRFLP